MKDTLVTFIRAFATPNTALVSVATLFALTLSGCAAPASEAEETAATEIDFAAIDDDTLFVLASYPIVNGELVGDAPQEQAAVWERFTELFDPELHPDVTMFVAIDAEQSGGTDGAMQRNSLYPDETYLALDTSGSVPPDVLDRTMIHEFAHLITLRDEQIPKDDSTVESCPVYTEIDGCPAEDSYLYSYFAEFWPGFTIDMFDAESEEDKELRYSADEFVTDYAATIPTEDAAEVFAEWVLADEVPAGDSIVEQKLRFFDSYPELVELRDSIRKGLFS